MLHRYFIYFLYQNQAFRKNGTRYRQDVSVENSGLTSAYFSQAAAVRIRKIVDVDESFRPVINVKLSDENCILLDISFFGVSGKTLSSIRGSIITPTFRSGTSSQNPLNLPWCLYSTGILIIDIIPRGLMLCWPDYISSSPVPLLPMIETARYWWCRTGPKNFCRFWMVNPIWVYPQAITKWCDAEDICRLCICPVLSIYVHCGLYQNTEIREMMILNRWSLVYSVRLWSGT